MMNSLMKAIASTLLLWSPMLVAVSTLAYPETTQSSTDREFVGTINHTLSVRIKLTQAGTVLSGSYVYEKIGKSLRLKGAMDGEVEFHTMNCGGINVTFDGTYRKIGPPKP